MAMNPIPILSTSPPPFDEQTTVDDYEFGGKPFTDDDEKDELFEAVESSKAQTTQSFVAESKTTNGEKIANGDQSSSESEDNWLHCNFNKRLNNDSEVTSCRSLELPDFETNIGDEVLNSNQCSPFHVRCDTRDEDTGSDFGEFATAFDSKVILESNDVLNFDVSPKNDNFNENFSDFFDPFRNEINGFEEKCEKETASPLNAISNSVEFDDFADFTCFNGSECVSDIKRNTQKCGSEAYECNVSEGMSINSNLVLKPLTEDDDFSEMCSAPPIDGPVSYSCLANVNQNNDNLDGNREFSDFSDFQSVPLTAVVNDGEKQLKHLVKDLFSNETKAADLDLCQEIVVNRDLMSSKSSFALWSKLQCLEETPSLKLKWQTSHSFQMFLQSLRIDPRNILHNPCVPKFAAGLGLLEPVKSSQQISANSDSTYTEKGVNDTSLTSYVPPVNFDWISSGLTNPLENNSSSLDLDFFLTAEARKIEKKTVVSDLEKELLKDNPATCAQVTKSSATNDTLYQLMSNNKYSSISCSLNKRPPKLSAEANQILDELPVLSFIRAKVLMFPVNGSN